MSFIRRLFGAGPKPDPADRDAGERGERAYLEFVGGSSAKFYAVVLSSDDDDGWSVAFNFGRIGTPRAWDHKVEEADQGTARRAFDDLIAEKERKGYERQRWPDSLSVPDGAEASAAGGEGEPSTPRTRTIFLSDQAGELPGATGGELAGVQLPPGRLFRPEENRGPRGEGDVLWISVEPVADVTRIWSRLAAVFRETGVWPLIIEADRGVDEFDERLMDIPRTKRTDIAAVLRHWWSESVGDEDEFDEESMAPFGRGFPGIAPRSPGNRPEVIDALVRDMTGHLGLVAVRRPADVLGAIGWMGAANYDADPFEQSLVLQSWEDRFDAYLVGLGSDNLELAVARPPRDRAAATAVSAEHFAFCPDNIWQGVGSIKAYAAHLEGAERWPFWWD